MKRYNVILLLLLLVSCSNTSEYLEKEKVLAEEKDIFKTMEAYRNACEINYNNDQYVLYLSTDRKKACCSVFSDNPERCGFTKDECQVFYNTRESSSICFFNYKKYLPDGTAKNDQDFQDIYYKFTQTRENVNYCSRQYDNQTKVNDCISNEKEKFLSYVRAVSNEPVSITTKGIAEQVEKKLSSERDIFNTLGVFSDLYLTSGYRERKGEMDDKYCVNYVDKGTKVDFHIENNIPMKERIEIMKEFAEPNAKIGCYFDIYRYVYDWSSETETNDVNEMKAYYDSDECIMARRNEHSSICFFDYKRFLPTTSKINGDQKFREAINLYWQYFRRGYSFDKRSFITYCDTLKEVTTAEKEQCEKNSRDFVIQYVNGKAPLCRNKVPNEYKAFIIKLNNGVSKINNFLQDDINSNIFSSKLDKQIHGGIMALGLGEAKAKTIKEFGIKHFCIPD